MFLASVTRRVPTDLYLNSDLSCSEFLVVENYVVYACFTIIVKKQLNNRFKFYVVFCVLCVVYSYFAYSRTTNFHL